MPGYEQEKEKFAGYDAQVVGICTDQIFSHIAWQQHEIGLLSYPLCSDYWPHGEVAQRYGVFRTGPPLAGINDRAVFVIDKEGRIAFAKVYDIGLNPPMEDVFQALEKVQAAAAR